MGRDPRPYLDGRTIEERPEGFVIIRPVDPSPVVPLACPVCDHVLRSRDDERSWEAYACCERCAMLWAHSRRDAWARGWRPTQEQVAEAEASRPPILTMMRCD